MHCLQPDYYIAQKFPLAKSLDSNIIHHRRNSQICLLLYCTAPMRTRRASIGIVRMRIRLETKKCDHVQKYLLQYDFYANSCSLP